MRKRNKSGIPLDIMSKNAIFPFEVPKIKILSYSEQENEVILRAIPFSVSLFS